VLIHRQWEREDLLDLLFCEVERLQGNPCVEAIPTCKGSRVFKIQGSQGELYLKHFHYLRKTDRVKALFRGTKSERSWRGGNLLRRLGFNTPPLVARGESTSPFAPCLDFLVTEAVAGPRLKHLLREGFEDRLAERGWRKGPFLKWLALTVADLHRKGIYHGDLNPTNILVNLEGELGLSTFCFLDNARCRRMRKVPYALRLKDLSGLNHPRLPSVSMRDRLRFFSIYQKHLGAHDPREMVRQIWQRSIRPRKRHRTSS
jgi:tRNA A-37 threonylcarbamoyl transferase component Bud32